MQVSKEDLRIAIGLVNEGQPMGSCSAVVFVERILIFAHENLIKRGKLLRVKKKILGINFPKVWLVIKAGWFLINLVIDIVRCLKLTHTQDFSTKENTDSSSNPKLTSLIKSIPENPNTDFWKEIKDFQSYEFDSPDVQGSGILMEEKFVRKMQKARDISRSIDPTIPFIINSGYRTLYHNKKVGGVKGSSHPRRCAADIKAKTSKARFIIVFSLLQAGFDRIGVADTFIHVDDDHKKASRLMWTY